MRRLLSVLAGIGLIAAIGITGATLPSSAADQPTFEATFDTAEDFYGRFDMGWSGWVPGQNGASSTITSFHGDHDLSCGSPDTSRTVNVSGPKTNFDFSQAFWHCAPGNDPAKGHVMTGLDTTGYNIVWFSPKPTFTNVSKVCWDINETVMSRRKWTQVVFVSAADAVRYSAGEPTSQPEGIARGTGGFDLGYVNPDFADPNGVTDGIIPSAATAGFRDLDGSSNWFQGTSWVVQFVGPNGADRDQTADKAARYQHCLEQTGVNVTLTKDTAQGVETYVLPGARIPQGPVRVVFEDDEYDGAKDDRYDPTVLTWHWDNIQVFAGDGTSPTTTTLPATTTSTSTTLPPSTTTTVAPTTTVPPSTTTTLAPIPACPSSFTALERTWCQRVMAHIAALEAKG